MGVDARMPTERDRPAHTLGDLLERRPALSLTRAFALTSNAALAIDRLHARGRVHGAITPASFVIQQDDRIELQGDGLTTNLAPGAESDRHYRSPQQLAGEPDRVSDDLYALGLVAYTLFFGRLPGGEAPPSDRSSHRPDATDETDESSDIRRHHVDAALRAQLTWSPSGRPATGAALVREIARAMAPDSTVAADHGDEDLAGRRALIGPPAAMGGRMARANLPAPDPRRQVSTSRPTATHATRRVGSSSDPIDVPLAGRWVTAIAIVLCSVYLLPLYFMLFGSG
jgi:serine/threonine protein kinase